MSTFIDNLSSIQAVVQLKFPVLQAICDHSKRQSLDPLVAPGRCLFKGPWALGNVQLKRSGLTGIVQDVKLKNPKREAY